jgi:hypothetical protein
MILTLIQLCQTSFDAIASSNSILINILHDGFPFLIYLIWFGIQLNAGNSLPCPLMLLRDMYLVDIQL